MDKEREIKIDKVTYTVERHFSPRIPLKELLVKSPLLADFKAVKEGHVWCTGKNLFQETMGLGNMIQDIHKMLTEEEPDPGQMHYIHKLR